MFWMWSSSRGGSYVGMGGMLIGLFFLFIMMAPVVSLRGFLPFLLIFFAPALLALMARRRSEQPRQHPLYEFDSPPEYEAEKPKRGEDWREMLSMMTDEELDDLHRRVRRRLADQIDSAGPDEIATFDELLTEAKEKRRG